MPAAAVVPRESPPPTKAKRAGALPPEQRREAIVAATLPLLLQRGAELTTREIAEAAGIAEGTIFRAFPDKDTLIAAVVEKALDDAPLDERIAGIDPALPLEERLVLAVQILQDHSSSVWQLVSSLGTGGFTKARHAHGPRCIETLPALVTLLEPDTDRLRDDAVTNARRLRAFTIAMGHPVLMGGERPSPPDVVSLFLDGVRRPDPDPAARRTRRASAR
jgi:AcrR family transcriptional regulator